MNEFTLKKSIDYTEYPLQIDNLSPVLFAISLLLPMEKSSQHLDRKRNELP